MRFTEVYFGHVTVEDFRRPRRNPALSHPRSRSTFPAARQTESSASFGKASLAIRTYSGSISSPIARFPQYQETPAIRR